MAKAAEINSRTLSDVQLKSVTLVHVNFERDLDVVPGRRDVRIEIGSEMSTDDPSAAVSRCRVSLDANDDDSGESPMSVESAYRVVFSSESADLESEDMQAHLAALAMRVCYPYHRQIIGQMISQSGLPPLLLPLVPDDQWVLNMNVKSEEVAAG
ncbi:protein-export chaperone SecB [Pseudarthrobacter sp. ATCC 49987]|uniref:protein-export chaperone SecB n=1 Tax=Pseudarthrobacter sp. ATCC 49987 TaxID=2698204 RepID=UPI00136C0BC0|nr:protein-export chaperone SecB [Pseudarthrobacter sp. ATCC 49987]